MNKPLIDLIQRSNDSGDNWRKVGDLLWPTVLRECEKMPDCVEIDHENHKVRLTPEGQWIAKKP